jgi:glycine cleavage system regulatory protein
MRNHFVATVIGPAVPGIIKALAITTRMHQGVWLASKVIKLDGSFAAIMSVVVEEEFEAALKSTLAQEFPHHHFSYAAPSVNYHEAKKNINLMVECIDRPGLTGDLSTILTNLDIGVENMECKRFAVDGIGDAVFSARLTLEIPVTTDSEVIAGEIEALSEDVRVNVL